MGSDQMFTAPNLDPVDDDKITKGERDIAEVIEVANELSTFTAAEERALVRKFDCHILPFIWLCYLFNSLDRSNVSNAKSDGMTVDLHFPTDGYGIMLSVFYVPFSTLGIPGVMLTRYIGPVWTIPGMMFGWGTMALINAGCTNFAGVVAVRLFLGAFEAGFIPSVLVYLTTFYTRGELAKRVAVFYSCTAISGAFSGLLGYAVFRIQSHLQGWQILFLIEGGTTVVLSIIVRLSLPWSPARARFLTERQKEIARLRILKDGSSEAGTSYNMKIFFAPLRDWRFYLFEAIVAAFSYGVAVSVASNFLTQIIGRFNFSVVKTNLFTVAPYVTAAVWLAGLSWSSDHFRERGFHLALCFCLVITGCLILVGINVDQIGVGYFACFLITMGSFSPSCIFHPWHQNNDQSEDGRAFRAGAVMFVGNSAGIVSANIFLSKWEPEYKIPLAITAGITALALVLTLWMRLWMAWDNRRRNRLQGVNWSTKDVPTQALVDGPSNPSYRHFC